MLRQAIESTAAWAYTTPVAAWVRGSIWAVPTLSVVHLFGLILLLGSIFMIALRCFGLAWRRDGAAVSRPDLCARDACRAGADDLQRIAAVCGRRRQIRRRASRSRYKMVALAVAVVVQSGVYVVAAREGTPDRVVTPQVDGDRRADVPAVDDCRSVRKIHRVLLNGADRRLMLSESDRKHAAQLLITAEAERKPVRQLSKTWPDITIEDAYAIQGEVIRHKTAAGAKIIGHKIGLTSKAMQQSSQIDEPDYGHLLDYMLFARRRQGDTRQLLRAARRGRARVRARQAAEGPGRRAARRAARHGIRGAGARAHRRPRARTRARSSTRWPTTPRRRASCSAAARSVRTTSICDGSAASCIATAEVEETGLAAGRAGASGDGHRLAGQQGRSVRHGARGGPPRVVRVVHPSGVGEQGRHHPRRFRAARRRVRALHLSARESRWWSFRSTHSSAR